MIEVLKGFKIPNLFAVTAFPFAIGSQNGNAGTRPYAWDDLLISPSHIFPVIILPTIAVMIAFKGVK